MSSEDAVFRKDLLAVALEGGAPEPVGLAKWLGVADWRGRAGAGFHSGLLRPDQCPECQRPLPAPPASAAQILAAHGRGCRTSAALLPAPKGYRCAAGCGHPISAHVAVGCMFSTDGGWVCSCEAPHGRILPQGQPGGPLGGELPPLDVDPGAGR